MFEPHTPVVTAGDQSRPCGDDVRTTVVGVVADVLDITVRDVGETSTLLQLGAESLMFVEIVLKLENAYGIHVDRTYALPNAHTVADYVAAVHAGLAAKGVAAT